MERQHYIICTMLLFFFTMTILYADPTPYPSIEHVKDEPIVQINGDVNSDKKIDIIDALLICQYYVGKNLENFNRDVADVNGDGRISIVDALLVAQYYVGITLV